MKSINHDAKKIDLQDMYYPLVLNDPGRSIRSDFNSK
jgi:hypothetical protein